ncbi:MFS transporter [Neoaquamicrobium sediminum]|uniref:MFS transporter n=1 Tax=Neoaquamicrobium sediminum TaxID=1849104 RepID=A0ABV3WWP4_9HYPH
MKARPVYLMLVVLAATTGMQTLAANSLFIMPAIAPEIAASIAVPAALIGYQVSVVYLGAMAMSVIAGSLSTMWGPVRTAQSGLLLGVIGLVLATTPHLMALVVASLLIGMGYGLINPPSVNMLDIVATPRNKGTLFSIKQTAVPLGGIVAGLVGPPVTLEYGWRAALVVCACLSLVMMFLVQPLAPRFDARRDRTVQLTKNPFRDLSLVWSHPILRWITLSAFFFAAVQFTLTTYLVTLLVEDVQLGLVAAGIALSVFQLAAVFGRLAWGALADLTGAGLRVLFTAYCLALASILPLIFMTRAWAIAFIYLVLSLLGVAGAGWNGVFVGETVHLAPPESGGRAIGGAFAFTFAGALLGPSAFAIAHSQIGLYTHTAVLIAAFAAAGCLCCALALHRVGARNRTCGGESR